MEIEQLKQIPISTLLSHLGYEPASRMRGGRQLMYYSPLRGDSNPSFSVSVDKNLWFDFGLSVGGNVIDLAIALNGGCSFHQAAVWLEDQSRSIGFGNPQPVVHTDLPRQRESEMLSVKVVPLSCMSLFSYLRSRCIPPDIGSRYCKEVHYKVRGKEFFGLCFLNILGGMEIRNPFFKGSFGVKAPSIISIEKEKRTEGCCIFEGFMDFLSYQTLKQLGNDGVLQLFPCDCIVLNSTSMVQKSYPFIDVYSRAFYYLDNDDAGRRAFEMLKHLMPGKVESCSAKYHSYNDVNDYLRAKVRSNDSCLIQ